MFKKLEELLCALAQQAAEDDRPEDTSAWLYAARQAGDLAKDRGER